MGYFDWFSVIDFPIGILGQVWYLIVSIPDLCNLTYFNFGLPLYVLKHLIRYKMVSNLIYFIFLIQHTAINICIIKNKYFKNIVIYHISYSDWFSAMLLIFDRRDTFYTAKIGIRWLHFLFFLSILLNININY